MNRIRRIQVLSDSQFFNGAFKITQSVIGNSGLIMPKRRLWIFLDTISSLRELRLPVHGCRATLCSKS